MKTTFRLVLSLMFACLLVVLSFGQRSFGRSGGFGGGRSTFSSPSRSNFSSPSRSLFSRPSNPATTRPSTPAYTRTGSGSFGRTNAFGRSNTTVSSNVRTSIRRPQTTTTAARSFSDYSPKYGRPRNTHIPSSWVSTHRPTRITYLGRPAYYYEGYGVSYSAVNPVVIGWYTPSVTRTVYVDTTPDYVPAPVVYSDNSGSGDGSGAIVVLVVVLVIAGLAFAFITSTTRY